MRKNKQQIDFFRNFVGNLGFRHRISMHTKKDAQKKTRKKKTHKKRRTKKERTIEPDVELVRIREFGTGGSRRSAAIVLLLKCDARSSKFSRSKTACCSFSSLIADISSSFCVSKDERVKRS